jgi:hypothetical protein
MIQSVSHHDRVATTGPLAGEWLEWIGQTVAAVLSWAARLCRVGRRAPELRMSREWLADYERRSSKHADGL